MSNFTEKVLRGAEYAQEKFITGYNTSRARYEKLSLKMEFLSELTKAEHLVRESNSEMYEALPEVLTVLASVKGLSPLEMIAMLEEARRLKTQDTAKDGDFFSR
jgi:hypothetical protein